LLVIQKAFEKAGLCVRPDMEIARPALIEDGRYTRSGPRQYRLGMMKTPAGDITVDTAGDLELADAVTIITPGGDREKAIEAGAEPGHQTGSAPRQDTFCQPGLGRPLH
jgi:hypothetical protein